jgi:release factor glutamine methyltransferase
VADLGVAPPTVAEALAAAAVVLGRSPVVEDAAAEARELLLALTDRPRSWLLDRATATLPADERRALLAAAARRASGAPIQYATGRAYFRHLTLAVDERVLIPRPETEVLVDLALAVAGEGGVAVDVGTGSGCIALALASEGRFERVIATDVSRDALVVAAANAEGMRSSLRAPVELRHGSLLAPVADVRARLVVSNPPYIASAESEALPAAVRDWEPPLALYSGQGGMAHVAALVRGAAPVLEPGGWLLMEVDARRASLAAELVATDGRYADVAVRLDLTGRERFVLARKRAGEGMLNDQPPGAARGTR